MNTDELRKNCLAVKGAEESMGSDEKMISYKVMGKVFAFFVIVPKDNEYFVVLKCDPPKSVQLREQYAGVTKGYYNGESLLWNSVYLEKDVPDELIISLIHHAADEVIKKLPKYKQAEYFSGKNNGNGI